MSIKAIRPAGDRAYMLWLEATTTEAATDLDAGIQWLPGNIRNQLNSARDAYRAAYDTRQTLYAARRQAVAKRVVAVRELVQSLRLAFRSVRGMAIKGQIEESQMDLYKLPSDKQFPNPTNYSAWLDVARRLLLGNASAVEAGLPPIPNPSPDLIQIELDAADVAGKAVKDAKKALKANEVVRDALRIQVYQLWRAASRKMRDALDGETPAKRREEMRRYGFLFINNNPGQPINNDTGEGGVIGDGETPNTDGTDDGETGGNTDDGTNGNGTTETPTGDGDTTTDQPTTPIAPTQTQQVAA